jgi:chemotaxis signal transduction protein
MAIDSQGGLLHVCVFRIADHSFALRLESISEIVPMAALSRPPLNVGGTPIPVLRVASLLGLPQDPLELYTPLVIIRGKQPLALLVKSVTGILSVASHALSPLSSASTFNGCVDGQLTAHDDVVHLIALERLLLEKEQHSVAGFREIETRRLAQADQASS